MKSSTSVSCSKTIVDKKQKKFHKLDINQMSLIREINNISGLIKTQFILDKIFLKDIITDFQNKVI